MPPKPASKPAPEEFTVVVDRQREVAEFFGVSLATIRSWSSERGMPGKPGAYDLGKITAWALSFGPLRSEGYRDDMLKHRIDSL